MTTQPPYLVSWNLTKRCNLLCSHCYLDSTELTGKDALSTADALRITAEITKLAPGAMLVLTGGEPLLRPDIFDIIREASLLGLNPVIGTNGTLLDSEVCGRLLDSGIKGAGVSLDSTTPSFHDSFRGVDGAWKKTLAGMDALADARIPFQLQFTITKENRFDIDSATAFAIGRGALSINFFFLVCTGRGQKTTGLAPNEYEAALEDIVRAEEKYGRKILVRARCAPHIVRVAERLNPESPLAKGATAGCVAAKGYLRISPEGLVTPCPYIPAGMNSPSVLKTPLKDIWEKDPSFLSLRAPALAGRCAECGYSDSCGGCRARALASKGNIFEEDPLCAYEPEKNEKTRTPQQAAPAWSVEALSRLEKIPPFLRPMIKKGLERYAASKGIDTITPELMAELRQNAGN